jgi:preprotein translocase subunit SecB
METKSAQLKLNRYFVEEIHVFIRDHDYHGASGDAKIGVSFEKIDENHGKLRLQAVLGPAEKDPYFLNAVVSGIFECENFEQGEETEKLMRNNSIAILYPYLRSLVSVSASIAGLPPVVLPVINTFSFFGSQIEEKKE